MAVLGPAAAFFISPASSAFPRAVEAQPLPSCPGRSRPRAPGSPPRSGRSPPSVPGSPRRRWSRHPWEEQGHAQEREGEEDKMRRERKKLPNSPQ